LTKAVGAIAAVTAFAILAWSFSPVGRANKEPKAPVRVTTEAGNARYPALSADGKLLAYASDRSGNYDIYVRQVGGSSDVRLTSSSHNESAPTFTPDGQYIVYQSDEPGAQVQVIPTLGGARRVLAARGVRPRVSPEGHHVLIWTNPHGGDEALGEGEIAVVPFAGGAPRRLQANFKHVGFPIWLEESNRYLFWGRTEPDAVSDWWVGDLNNDTAQGTGVGPAAKKLGMMRRVPKPAFAYGGSVYGWMQVGDTHTLIKAEFPRDNPKGRAEVDESARHPRQDAGTVGLFEWVGGLWGEHP
jgi:dipeptidyl aminopeptidase/acylaminoacyl peptidase